MTNGGTNSDEGEWRRSFAAFGKTIQKLFIDDRDKTNRQTRRRLRVDVESLNVANGVKLTGINLELSQATQLNSICLPLSKDWPSTCKAEISSAVEERLANPYFAVEIEGHHLWTLREGLLRAISGDGLVCEEASKDMHVSLAYARGTTDLDHLARIGRQIAEAPFAVHVDQFAILEGEATPFDYLALCLDRSPDFHNAVDVVERTLAIRKFHGGFKSHISLLKFPKGELKKSTAKKMVRELNASRGVALVLGRAVCLEGRCVCIYTEDRKPICRVPCLPKIDPEEASARKDFRAEFRAC